MERTCGECTLCCTLLGVPELDKPADTKCTHCIMNGGCKIYEERPGSCRAFNCVWLLHPEIEDEYRPDKLHAVPFAWMTTDGQPAVGIKEDPSYAGRWQKGKLKKLIERFKATGVFVFLIGGKEGDEWKQRL